MQTGNHLNTECVQIIKDFDVFVSYVEEYSVQLTKTKGQITRKHLLELNNRLTVRNETATKYTEQEYYPYIHFFYCLCLSGQLLTKESGERRTLLLRPTERLHMYRDLTEVEKYFFLLEIFWVDLDWTSMIDRRNPLEISLQEVLFSLNDKKAGYKISSQHTIYNDLRDWKYFLLYFEWFGFWICQRDQKSIDTYYKKNVYFAKSIELTKLGSSILPILFVERNIHIWNISERENCGEVNPLPGEKLDHIIFGEISEEMVDEIYERMEQDQSSQLFLEPFKRFYPDGSLLKSLPRNKVKCIKGVYTFKISYTNNVWRQIVLSSSHTMDDLHGAILGAFDFDDDHLYSFFMDGIKWSNKCIVSPLDDDGHPQADQVYIGDLALECGKNFIYLFDFGEEWVFAVEVTNIEKIDFDPFNPYLKESKGESPQQYGDWFE